MFWIADCALSKRQRYMLSLIAPLQRTRTPHVAPAVDAIPVPAKAVTETYCWAQAGRQRRLSAALREFVDDDVVDVSATMTLQAGQALALRLRFSPSGASFPPLRRGPLP